MWCSSETCKRVVASIDPELLRDWIEDTDLLQKAASAEDRDGVEKIYVNRLDELGVGLYSDGDTAESESSEDAEHTARGSQSENEADDTEDTDSTDEGADTDDTDSQDETSGDSLSSALTTTGFDDSDDEDGDFETDTVSNLPETDDEQPESEPNSDSDDPWTGIDVESIAPGSMDADTPRRWSILTWADPDQRKLHPSGTDDTGILIDREWLRDRTVLAAKRIDRKLP
jgi:hypothetical protein